jgi:uncharacterized membrane protein
MARTATKGRSSSARRASGGSAKKRPVKAAGRAAKRAAQGPSKAQAVKHPVKTAARAATLKALKALAGKAAEMAAHGVRSATDRATAASKGALENGLGARLPIQTSIDVAVPLLVAWEEWMTFDPFTEGVHRIEDVERDGDELIGTIVGPRAVDWRAEIVDEREQEAFAWRSVEGSDCAGLITFHRLSERLTRIEVDLDVLPTNPAETLTLSLHLAHHRVTTDLRRFKARVEFINPDVYEAELSRNGNAPDTEDDNAPTGENDE